MMGGPDSGADMAASKETEQRNETVRILLTRSARSETLEKQIRESNLEDLANIDLVEAVMIEKSKDAHNPGQIMPVGGKVEPGETQKTAVAREVLYETHLRLTQEPVKLGEMDYKIPNKTASNHANFYASKILPGDIGFPLTPKEDKVARVHYLPLTDFELLLITGKLKKKDKTDLADQPNVLQSSLMTDWETGLRDDEQRQAQNIKIKMLEYLKQQQSFKRREVLLDFIIDNEKLWQDLDLDEQMSEYEMKIWRANFENDNNLTGLRGEQKIKRSRHLVDGIWTDIFKKIDEKIKEKFGSDAGSWEQASAQIKSSLLRAIETSNLSEELKGENAGRSQAESILRFIYTMLETRSFDDSVLEPAKQNPQLANFVGKLETFLINPTGKKAKKRKNKNNAVVDEEPQSRRLVSLAEQIGDDLDDHKKAKKIEERFIRTFNLAPKGIGFEKQKGIVTKRLVEINRFLSYLIHEGLKKKIHGGFMPEMLEQLNSIKAGDLNYLLKMALPMKKTSRRYQEMKKIHGSTLLLAVFEARRQLGLLMVLTPVAEYYEKIEEQSVSPIEMVFQKIFSMPDQIRFLRQIFNEKGELVDEIVDEQPFDNETGNGANGKEINLRKFKGQNEFLAWVNKPDPKRMESVFRKFLEKALGLPEEIKDINRRAVNLASEGEQRMLFDEEIKKLIDSGYLSFSDSEIKEEDKEMMTERSEIIQIIKELIIKGNGKIKISNYTPTSRSGQGFASKSAGGEGNKLRFAKFNVVYSGGRGGKDKVEEEVQVFSPSSDGKSGFYWEEIKKQDDERYFIDRLFKTKTLRSLVELLFPVQIYSYYIRSALVSALASSRHNVNASFSPPVRAHF